MTSRFTRLIPLAAALLAGCAVGPDYVRPAIDTPAQYKENGQWKVAEPLDEQPRGDWWTVFGDPTLDRLVDTLNRQSPSIAQAEAQYRQTEALLRQAQSSAFPSLSANVGATRSAGGGTGGSSSSARSIGNSYTLGLAASWEIDLWGGVQRGIEAGRAKLDASAAQLAAARLSAQAQLASAYLQLRVADRQQRQLEDTVAAYTEALRVTQNQYAAGVVSEADVAQSQTQLKAAEVQLVDKRLARAQLEHAVAVASGQNPSSFSLPADLSEPHLPTIPPGLPSALLERRPDIAAAERNMAAANAAIGVARAAYFPTLTLGANGGYRSSSFADWVSLPNRVWSIGPSIALALFDAGLRRAQSDQAVAVYDASVASYRQTVLSAFQAVEDNLAAQRMLAEEAALQDTAVAAARRAETIALNQYKAGTASYLSVVTAQGNRLSAERTAWDIRNRRYTTSVALITAIGGHW